MANYLTVKAGIVALLKALGYVESSQTIDFKNAPNNEYNSRFILKNLSGENQDDTIVDRFHDAQEWQILIGFSRSSQSDVVQYDKVHIAKDLILKKFEKPSNWESFVKLLKYNKWEVMETPNYFVLDIRLSILDIYVHG